MTYPGLEKPVTLYLDAYRFEEPMAPAGFVCAENRLGAPPIDGFLASDLAVRLAVEQGADREFAPISLDADGSAKHGAAFDLFRLMARDARAAKASSIARSFRRDSRSAGSSSSRIRSRAVSAAGEVCTGGGTTVTLPVRDWRAEPARINMSPVISESLVVLRFQR